MPWCGTFWTATRLWHGCALRGPPERMRPGYGEGTPSEGVGDLQGRASSYFRASQEKIASGTLSSAPASQPRLPWHELGSKQELVRIHSLHDNPALSRLHYTIRIANSIDEEGPWGRPLRLRPLLPPLAILLKGGSLMIWRRNRKTKGKGASEKKDKIDKKHKKGGDSAKQRSLAEFIVWDKRILQKKQSWGDRTKYGWWVWQLYHVM